MTQHTHRLRSLAVLVACLTLVLAPARGSGGDGEPARRVVLIVCDTLSAHHLASYAPGSVKAGIFSDLASRGVLFKRCITPQVWTLSAHMSLFTGLEPGVHRVGALTALPETIPLLAERFADAGLVVGHYRSENGWLEPGFGFDRGTTTDRTFAVGGRLEDDLIGWLDELQGDGTDPAAAPNLLFVHYMDVHTRTPDWHMPYQPRNQRALRREIGPRPPKKIKQVLAEGDTVPTAKWDLDAYGAEFLRKTYDLCAGEWDALRLGRLVREVLTRPGFEDALVIVTSDHGEEFQEHGRFLHVSPHAEVRDVPLLVIWPGRLPAGVVIDEPVSITDLAPTILDFADLPAPEVCQGVSLRPTLEGTAGVRDRDFFIDGHSRDRDLVESAYLGRVDGTWYSLIAQTDTTGTLGTYRPETVTGTLALFDLDADPGETRDLLAQRPEVARVLRERMDAHLVENARLAEELGTEEKTEALRLSEQEKSKLRALGY